jgi:Lrp/AsnC family leucine-responsive transcriptional regulator
MSREAVAREVNLSRPAVHERIKRLENDGVIRGYRTLVDWAALV